MTGGIAIPSRTRIFAALWGLLLVASMWVAHQGGLISERPEAFIGPVYVLVTAGFWVALFWLSAMGWGMPIKRLLVPEITGGAAWVAQAGAGAATLLCLHWLGAWLIGINATLAWVLIVGGLALLAFEVQRARHPAADTMASWSLPLSALATAPPLGLMLVAATCPPGTLWAVEAFGYDTLTYHLQIPREWVASGHMVGLQHNVFSYLPGLMESGYTMLITLTGGMSATAIYASQLLHVSMALLAAVTVGVIVARLVGRSAGGWAAALLLATPWVVITGSLAYNDMAAVALGTTGLLVVFASHTIQPRTAVLVGFLAGVATLCKLTAGFMIALPVGLIVMGYACKDTSGVGPRWRRALMAASVAALAGVLTLSPYLLRNTLWTGNPVFPFLTHTLGHAHWTAHQAERWDQAHAPTGDATHRLIQQARRGIFNPGYGAIGGILRNREIPTHDITLFAREWGFPLLGVLTLIGTVIGWRKRETRPAVAAMLLMHAVQAFFWLTATHMQSRFMLPVLIPVVTLSALAWGGASRWIGQAVPAVCVPLVTILSFTIFFDQTPRALPPWMLADSLPESAQPDHPINRLPPASKTLLVGDVTRVLYLRQPFVYASAYDTNPLAQIIQQTGADTASITQSLRKAGVTHVWIGWGELSRLRATIGVDPQLTPELLQNLAASWRVEYDSDRGDATLYALP